MKKIILSVLVAMVLAACAKEEASIAKIEEVKNPYAVTTDEAVQLLQTVIGGESTRAISVGEIKTLRKSDFVPTTRGADDGDLIYIVDLENGGSAIMGADKRMEPIYAILDETKVSPEQLTLSATRSDDGEQDIEEYVMGLVNNKIQVDVMGFGHTLPEMPIVPRPQRFTVTTQLGSKTPLLRTKWSQFTPYNDHYPNGLLAGCGPIALAQIIYFFRTPDTYSFYTFDWELISECEYQGSFSNEACSEVADLVYAIGGMVCSNWHNGANSNSNTDIVDCRSALGSLLNVCVSVQIYDYAGIKGLLDNNKPIYTRGDDMDNEVAHAWVIDGYNSYIEKIYEREYDGLNPSEYTDTLISSTTYNLVHCNYGWAGLCDGYYASGVFDVSSELEDDMVDTSIGDVQGTKGRVYDSFIEYIFY